MLNWTPCNQRCIWNHHDNNSRGITYLLNNINGAFSCLRYLFLHEFCSKHMKYAICKIKKKFIVQWVESGSNIVFKFHEKLEIDKKWCQTNFLTLILTEMMHFATISSINFSCFFIKTLLVFLRLSLTGLKFFFIIILFVQYSLH